jgi:hypothetical protein
MPPASDGQFDFAPVTGSKLIAFFGEVESMKPCHTLLPPVYKETAVACARIVEDNEASR